MAQKTRAELLTQKQTIKTETIANANSATRIGQMHEDEIDSAFIKNDDSYTAPFPQVTATGTNTYAATLAPAITAYATGQKFQIKFTNASSGVSTLNLNAVGAKKIFVNPTTQATTGHIVAGQISLLAYDAALDAAAGGFLMLGAPSTSASTLGAILTSSNDATGLQIKNLFDGSDPQDAVTLGQLTAASLGLWDDRGSFSAAGGAYPSSGGSGTAGAIIRGDIWTISVAGTLPTGQVVEIGDTVRALIDTPGNTQANWAILQNNIGFVPGNVANPLSQFAATTSAQLAGVISDETGSGALVFGTSPTLVTPALGTPSAVVLTNGTGLPGASVINTPAGSIAATTAQAAINELDTEKQSIANTASALTDGASIAITGAKHTLTTTQSAITFSQSFTGDFLNIDVTFNTTAATWTFPTGSLCVVEGSASGNNTATIAAVSGDKIVISIWFVSSGNYRVACKNFGQ